MMINIRYDIGHSGQQHEFFKSNPEFVLVCAEFTYHAPEHLCVRHIHAPTPHVQLSDKLLTSPLYN